MLWASCAGITGGRQSHDGLSSMLARQPAEPRLRPERSYSLAEEELQAKFAAVTSRTRRRSEAAHVFKTPLTHVAPAWMASRTADSSLAMLQVCTA